MKLSKTLGLAVAGTLVACVTLGAQSQEPRPAAPDTKPSNSAMDRTVTIVGCLVRDTVAKPEGAPSGPMFKITNVAPATGSLPSGAPAAGETTGRARGRTSGAGSTEPLAREYRLMAMGGVDLSEHLNHKMQLTGTITPASDTAPGATRGGASGRSASGTEGAASASAPRPAGPATLHVTSATMVALSCQ